MKIGFIGLGAMGRPMAKNLISASYFVQGYDIYAPNLELFGGFGGVKCATAQDAARGSDLLILMVVNAAQANSILFEEGALEALNPNASIMLCATCSPKAVQEISERVEKTQRHFIDAPVSGGVVGAVSGALTMMVACSKNEFETMKPVLDVLGSRVFHVGENAGQGAMVKVINQLLCGVHIVAAAEALSLGKKTGLDPSILLDIFGSSAAGSWMLNNRGPRMVQSEPEVTSAVDIFVKDMGLVMEAAKDAKATVLLAPLTEQLFKAAHNLGLGRADDSQVIQTYTTLNG